MEPNYSRHALIQAFCRSITRGVTLAFQSPSICFEICDNQSRLPFVTACSVWWRGKKAWPSAMEEFPCFLLRSSKLSSPVPLTHKCVCALSERTVGCVLVCVTVYHPRVDTCVCTRARACVFVAVLYQRRVRSNSQSITLRGLQWLWQSGGG